MATTGQNLIGILIGAGIGYLKEKNNPNHRYFSPEVQKSHLLKASLKGAVGGLVASEIFGTPRDTVIYTLYNKRGREVYVGITYSYRLQTRLKEHRKAGKVFDSYSSSPVITRPTAEKREARIIGQNKPKYNWQHNPDKRRS